MTGCSSLRTRLLYIEHPQKLEDLDLRDVLELPPEQRSTPAHLLVPILVVDELDALKKSKDRHERWRARHTLAVLDDRLANPSACTQLRAADPSIPRGELTVELVFDPPGHVRLPSNDEEIIDRAVSIDSLAGRKIRFLTYDTGQSTRARRAGLHTIKIPQRPEGDEPSPR